MFAYQAVPFVPVFSRRIVPRMGQQTPTAKAPDVAPGTVRTVVTAGYIVELGIYGAASWVGIWAGQKATGFLSAAGWTVGILAGLRGIISLAELVVFAAKGMPLPEGAKPAPPGPGEAARA